MTRLSVNVNKLATLRNSREKNLPDVTKWAKKILEYGAHGITVHPRPDGRHIRLHDVDSISALVKEWNSEGLGDKVEFNVEGYPSEEFMKLIERVRPHQATLVPDPPEAITSNAGWDLVKNEPILAEILERLRKTTRVSLFVEPSKFAAPEEAALARLKPDRIELYTESFHDEFTTGQKMVTTGYYVRVAERAKALGIGVNAGHDLNQMNLGFLTESIPWIDEVSIGHALICEALEDGMETTIKNYLKILKAT